MTVRVVLLAFLLTLLHQTAQAQWAWKLGGASGGAQTVAVASDDTGAAYVVGTYELRAQIATTFLEGPGETFAAKFSETGQLQWAVRLGRFEPFGISTDSRGAFYVAGWTPSTNDYDPGPGTAEILLPDDGSSTWHIALAKYDSSGAFQWVIPIFNGGLSDKIAVAVDPSDHVHVLGNYMRGPVDLDPSEGEYLLPDADDTFGWFVAAYSGNGDLLRAVHAEEGTVATATNLAFGQNGELVVIGNAVLMERQAACPQGNPGWGCDFVARFDSSGARLAMATFSPVDRQSQSDVNDVAVGRDGAIYITGDVSGGVDFDPGPDERILTGSWWSGVLGAYTPDLTMKWASVVARPTGGEIGAWSRGKNLLLGQQEQVIMISQFEGTVDVDPSPDEASLSGRLAYGVARYNAAGEFIQAWSVGGNGLSGRRGSLAALSPDSMSLYLGGTFYGEQDFDPDPDRTVVMNSFGTFDGFILRTRLDGSQPPIAVRTEESSPPRDDQRLEVFPNPFRTHATVILEPSQSGPAAVELVDLLGRSVQRVHTGSLVSGTRYQFTLSAPMSASGLYFLRVVQEGDVYTRKVTILK